MNISAHVPFLFALLLGSSEAVAAPVETRDVRIRFLDSATGYAVQPERLTAQHRRGAGVAQGALDRGLVARSGRAGLRLEAGRHRLTAIAPGYRLLSGDIEVGEDRAYALEFHLDPIAPPIEFEPDYIATLHREDETLFVGCVVDDESGQPLADVQVRSEPSGRTASSDARGFFQLYVPVQTLDEAFTAPARLIFERPGYVGEERRYLELWSRGDWIYRIRLDRGDGWKIVDERERRRRTHYPLETRCGERAADDTAELGAGEFALSFHSHEAGREPFSSTTATIRVPANIRVLRQDGVTVDYVSLETYCQRVLPSEWIASWGSYSGGTNSLKAGAVAVRTYAVGYVNSPLSGSYDICGTTACQVYNPTASDSRTTAACDQTAGVVLFRPGDNRVGFKLTEYSAENNSLGFACGDGYTQPTWGCLYDPVCAGETRFGHGRGLSDGRAVEEVTAALAALCPDDPLRYDFALCHLGISGRCIHRRSPEHCPGCPIEPICAL